ncbi:MAG: NADH-quinone oxidoreductase subunit L, partial [Acidobacteria bacterium]|nr:NADH-quinone oxidoreductase subunit L [Acidobacteriota bacterium]
PQAEHADTHMKHTLELVSVGVSLSGIAVAWLLFLKYPQLAQSLRNNFGLLHRYWKAAWGFDWLYELLFVRPYLWFVRVNRNDGFDIAIGGIPIALSAAHGQLARTQTGRLRWYAAAVGAGACLLIAGVVFL